MSVEDQFFKSITVLGIVMASPLNAAFFNFQKRDLIEGVKVADPAHYYNETEIPVEISLAS